MASITTRGLPVSYEAIPFPTGQSSAQIYNWATGTSLALRRILQQVTGGADGVDLAQLSSDVAALQSETASLQEQIDSLSVDNGWTPQRVFELSLVTRADEIFGSYSELRSRAQTEKEQNADASMRAAIEAAKANSGVRSTVRVLNDTKLALSERIDTVSADLGVTNANVVNLTQAVSDGDESLAEQLDTLTSTVAGNTASISIVTSSVNGVLTRFAVALNSQNEVIGTIKLDGSPAGSAFTVNVDSFQVGKAGTSGGTSVPVFEINMVGGTPSIVFRGTLIGDGTIQARMIQAGSVTADKIAANTLSAITANLGTITAGLIRNAADSGRFDVTNMRIYKTDGKVDFDIANGRLLFRTA